MNKPTALILITITSACADRPLEYTPPSTVTTRSTDAAMAIVDIATANEDMTEFPDLMPVCAPGSSEQCNGIDDNCDAIIDEGCESTRPGSTETPLWLTYKSLDSNRNPVFLWAGDGVHALMNAHIICGHVSMPLASTTGESFTVALPDHSPGTVYPCQVQGTYAGDLSIKYSFILKIGY